MLERNSRLRLSSGLGKDESQASEEAFRKLKDLGLEHPPPLLSDGWGGIRDALVEVFGHVPAYSGRGRPPTRKQAASDWRYLQVIKDRDPKGRFKGLRYKAIFGSLDDLTSIFGENTAVAFLERQHLTMRQAGGRFARKTLAFSRKLKLHKAAIALDDAVHNLVKPLKTLRLQTNPNAQRFERRYQDRSPAMAAGRADHLWTLEELLRIQVIPIPLNT